MAYPVVHRLRIDGGEATMAATLFISTLEQLAEWIQQADRTLVF